MSPYLFVAVLFGIERTSWPATAAGEAGAAHGLQPPGWPGHVLLRQRRALRCAQRATGRGLMRAARVTPAVQRSAMQANRPSPTFEAAKGLRRSRAL